MREPDIIISEPNLTSRPPSVLESMKLFTLATCLMIAPLALCTAQTLTPKPPVVQTPAPPTPLPAVPVNPAAPKPMLEDIPGADPVVITVGDQTVTKSEFESLLASLPDQVRASAQQGPGKRRLAEQLVDLKVLAQEARKRGVDRNPDTRQMIAFQTDNVLANTLYRDIAGKLKVDEAAERAYFDAHKNEFEHVKASHILVRFKGASAPARPGEKDLTEEEALAKIQGLRKRLVAGEDFAKLSSTESDDTVAGKNGGSLGSFGRGQMDSAFEKVAFELPVGQISEPVKTKFGYHLIKVEEHTPPKFEDLRASIEQRLKPEMAKKAVDDIRKQTPVSLNDAYFSK